MKQWRTNTKPTASKMIRLLARASNSSEFPVYPRRKRRWLKMSQPYYTIFRVHIAGVRKCECVAKTFRSVTLSNPAILICIDWWHSAEASDLSRCRVLQPNAYAIVSSVPRISFLLCCPGRDWCAQTGARTDECNWKPRIDNVLGVRHRRWCVRLQLWYLCLSVFAKINDSKWQRRCDDLIFRSKESNAKSRHQQKAINCQRGVVAGIDLCRIGTKLNRINPIQLNTLTSHRHTQRRDEKNKIICIEMRLINCSDCFSLRCSDDGSVHPDRALHKAGRHLRGLTKAIFQRHQSTPATLSSPSWICTKVSGTKTYGYADDCVDARSSHRQYPIERKHKVKKRDLVKQQLLIAEAGNFLIHFLQEYRPICFPWNRSDRFYGQIQLKIWNSIQICSNQRTKKTRFYSSIQFHWNLKRAFGFVRTNVEGFLFRSPFVS